MAGIQGGNLTKAYPMVGGDGVHSYTNNSTIQKEAAAMAKKMLVAAIMENLDTDLEHATPSTFSVADLGCSTGPNTFFAVDNIIEIVTQKYKSSSLPEFQVYFNDHVSNDFNVLFTNMALNRKYFAAGVPGSFYGRLFPAASLNLVYSAFALQWLSNVPQEVYNRGRIHYSNAPPEVGQAYSCQYERDMGSFLEARAQELAPGGLLVFLIPGRPDGTIPSESSPGPLFRPLESCLLDMAEEGILSIDKIDSFNLPIYAPSMEELRTLIQKNGSFDIRRLEPTPQIPTTRIPTTEERIAGLGNILKDHFGVEIIEQVFQRYRKKIAGHPPVISPVGLFVLLKRNAIIN